MWKQSEYLTGGYDLDWGSALKAILDTEISHALTKMLIRTSLLKDNNLHYAEGVNLDEKLQICAPIFFMQSLCMGSRKSNGTVINRMT